MEPLTIFGMSKAVETGKLLGRRDPCDIRPIQSDRLRPIEMFGTFVVRGLGVLGTFSGVQRPRTLEPRDRGVSTIREGSIERLERLADLSAFPRCARQREEEAGIRG